MLRRIIVLFLTLCLALPGLATDSEIYTVSVPVANQSEAQRTEAFAMALQVVVDRLHTNTTPLEHPEQYVESFSYIADPEQPDALEINVRFDRQALQPFLPEQQVVQSQSVHVQVTGITSLMALNALSDALSHASRVQSVTVQQVFDDKVDVNVVFQGNVANLIQALMTNPHLSSMSTENTSDQSLLYFQWMD